MTLIDKRSIYIKGTFMKPTKEQLERIPASFDPYGNPLPIRLKVWLERWDEQLGTAEFLPAHVASMARLHCSVALLVGGQWIYGGFLYEDGSVIEDQADFDFAYAAARNVWLEPHGVGIAPCPIR